jgi:hypothetical protein
MATLRGNIIFEGGGRRLIAIERVILSHGISDIHRGLYASITPQAVIVSGTDGSYVLDLELGRISIQGLIRKNPELESVLASFELRRE